MQRVTIIGLVVLTAVAGFAQSPSPTQSPQQPGGRGGVAGRGVPAGPEEILLWENGAPGAQGEADADKPTITAYRAPRGSSGTAVLIAPGGGYGGLALEHEGRQEAYWFNAMGVTAFVLKYRLGPRYRHPVQLGDAQRAIRMIRTRAADFNVIPGRIGMMGFSAGGHLTSTAGTHFDAGRADATDSVDRASSRPDFLILGYPVVSFDPAVTHAGSVRNLLGDSPDPALIAELSNDLRVTPQTPPTFLFHTSDDAAVPVENSVRFYLALRKVKVPAEMHLFETGPHGVGMALADPALSAWPSLLMNWMRARGLLSKG